MFNPAILMRLQGMKDTFVRNHPKFPAFLKAVGNTALEEGAIIEMQITKTNGEVLKTNIKLQESDVELLKEILQMAAK